jgi:hypothetical protein
LKRKLDVSLKRLDYLEQLLELVKQRCDACDKKKRKSKS